MKYLPLFPLELVVFEGEKVRLHIFEPRYKQLIHEVMEENTSFGMPVVFEKKLEGTGAELGAVTLIETWPGGEMDIECTALSRFEILDFHPVAKGKLYGGGFVQDLPFIDNEDKELKLRIADLLRELYTHTQFDGGKFPDPAADFPVWVHKCGLLPQQELELAALTSMSDRQLYVINHLKNLLSSLSALRDMREKIMLNGHFKKMSNPL
ncbi:MAG: LON peptidase substrate-binding domain-containing protein [Sphingomonadales bacterium]|jgi:ATP-dependent Lon protease